MDDINYFEVLLESIPNVERLSFYFSYFKMVWIYCSRLVLVNVLLIVQVLEFKNIKMEQFDECLTYIKNEEEAIIEMILEK